ncbi:MAG: sugar transferase [Ignavibacteriales bacterium]
MTIYDRYVKRIIDIVLSFIGLVVLLPLFLIIGVCIKLDSPGPVFFIQERAGKKGQPFRIYKFRTMVFNAERIGDGYYVGARDPRVTRVGSLLRKTSIDELPQLINILKGEMSIIGPRPTLLYQVEQYDDYQRHRLDVRPGVSGWAQVHGRNSLSWPERIKYDVWYVQNISILLDLLIMLKTFNALAASEDVYAEKEKFIIRDSDELEVNKKGADEWKES